MSWIEASAGGMGTSMIEVRRDAVDGYELADARTMDNKLSVSSVVGNSFASRDWNRSGCLASINN